jgi:hypothetical protein
LFGRRRSDLGGALALAARLPRQTQPVAAPWRGYEIAAKATVAIPAGKGVVGFQLSGAKQTIEIGQTIVLSGTKSPGAAPAGTRAASAVDLHFAAAAQSIEVGQVFVLKQLPVGEAGR